MDGQAPAAAALLTREPPHRLPGHLVQHAAPHGGQPWEAAAEEQVQPAEQDRGAVAEREQGERCGCGRAQAQAQAHWRRCRSPRSRRISPSASPPLLLSRQLLPQLGQAARKGAARRRLQADLAVERVRQRDGQVLRKARRQECDV